MGRITADVRVRSPRHLPSTPAHVSAPRHFLLLAYASSSSSSILCLISLALDCECPQDAAHARGDGVGTDQSDGIARRRYHRCADGVGDRTAARQDLRRVLWWWPGDELDPGLRMRCGDSDRETGIDGCMSLDSAWWTRGLASICCNMTVSLVPAAGPVPTKNPRDKYDRSRCCVGRSNRDDFRPGRLSFFPYSHLGSITAASDGHSSDDAVDGRSWRRRRRRSG